MLWLSNVAFAGLGPASVVVLYNADVPDAVSVAEAYATARSIPAAQLCGLSGIDPLATTIALDAFQTSVRDPLTACLAALAQPDEIDALVTVRGLPYVVSLATPDDYVVGFESALQVGLGVGSTGEVILGSGQTFNSPGGYWLASVRNPEFLAPTTFCDAGELTIDNPYRNSYRSTCAIEAMDKLPRAFRRGAPHDYAGWDLTGELFVVSRLDGFDYTDAMALVDRGAEADGAFPSAPLMCMRGADEARAARDPECELATRRLGEAGQWIDAFDGALSGIEVSAYFTGSADLTGAIAGVTYAPGAIADNLTSFGAAPQNFFCDDSGAVCPAAESQTSIARFVRAGATGAHGTVAEPLNNVFPNAGALLLYASGYSLGESFLDDQEFLYWQNLLLGDPLATPFAERPVVTLPAGVSVDGTLDVTASHPDGVTELRLYLNGVHVADADGDSLSWPVEGADGDTLQVLAIAVAGDHDYARGADWPVATQTSRAAVQGWAAAELPVGEMIVDTPPGCGCQTPTPGGAGWMLVLLAAPVRRGREPASRST